MLELKALHTKRLMVNFESDEIKQEREIDIVTQEITEIFRNVEGALKSFAGGQNLSEADLRVQQNIQRSMAKKLQGLSMSFRTSQKVIIINHTSLFSILFFLCTQEYLVRLQAQKSGSGAQAFEFLGDDKKKKGANPADPGFNETQIMMVDDVVKVRNSILSEYSVIYKEYQ